MNTIVAAALLVTATLATPLGLQPVPDTTNVTIQTRQGPTSSITLIGVSLSTYMEEGCTGDPFYKDEDLHYNTKYEGGMQSYSLSGNISLDHYWLSVYVPNTNSPCSIIDYNLVGDYAEAGCHTLGGIVGFMGFWPTKNKPRSSGLDVYFTTGVD